jgi:hypothetical protein
VAEVFVAANMYFQASMIRVSVFLQEIEVSVIVTEYLFFPVSLAEYLFLEEMVCIGYRDGIPVSARLP